MASLLRLPTELLTEIFGYLHVVVPSEKVPFRRRTPPPESSSASSSASVEDTPPPASQEQEQRLTLGLTLLSDQDPEFAEAYYNASPEVRENLDRQVAELGNRIMAQLLDDHLSEDERSVGVVSHYSADEEPEDEPSVEELLEEPKAKNDYNSVASYRTLQALARTCRTLYPVARQMLYEQYRADSEKPITGFIHRLAVEPFLRPYVKHIHITDNMTLGKLRTKEEIMDELQHVVTLGAPYLIPDQDAADLELANLLAHTANVETIAVEGKWRDGISRIDVLPLWLYPLIEAAQSIPVEALGGAKYNNLQTLDINLQFQYNSDVAYLFLLPGLRKLRLANIFHSDGRLGPLVDRWPVGAAISSLHTLELPNLRITGDQVVNMINSCKALSHLRCDWEPGHLVQDAHGWTQRIVSALEHHSQTLKTLLLEPEEPKRSFLMPCFDWPRIEGLKKLSELQSLTTSFYVLMGRPAGELTDESWTPANPNWHGFPTMREVLPPNIRSLSLSMGLWNMYPNEGEGYEQLFMSALIPPPDQKPCLEQVKLSFGDIECYYQQQLPLDFWEIQKAFHDSSVTFNYHLHTDLGPGGTCDPIPSQCRENTCSSFTLAPTQCGRQSCSCGHTKIILKRTTDELNRL
jgi:hypothetical protein